MILAKKYIPGYYPTKYAVIVFDEKLHIAQINQQAQTMIGWNLHEAKGKIITEIMQFFEQQTLRNLENKIISTVQQRDTLYYHKGILLMDRDGNMTPIASSINSFKNDQDELTGGIIVFWEER